MGKVARWTLGLALALSTAASAQGNAPCADGPAMRGMRERIVSLRDQMDRIDVMADAAERRNLMDLNMKKMAEGMKQIRARDLGPACRMEMMGDMMDVMIRHQHAMHAQERR